MKKEIFLDERVARDINQLKDVCSDQLFDFYLNKNQIIIEKLTPKLIYENFIED